MNNTTAEPWCPSCASIAKDIRLKVQNLATLYTCTDEWHDAEARRTDVSDTPRTEQKDLDEVFLTTTAWPTDTQGLMVSHYAYLRNAERARKVISRLHAELAAERKRADAAEKDAKRYRWLRDKSVPPHNFYISVPVEFHEVRYKPNEVDSYIDEAMKNG